VKASPFYFQGFLDLRGAGAVRDFVSFNMISVCCFCSIFILLVKRKRRWRYILDESALALELSISNFSSCFFDFFTLNLLLVRSHKSEIIVENRLIQGRNNVCDEGVTSSIPMQDKTEDFFMQRLRTPAAGSDSPPPWLSCIRASPARHLRHYFFHF